MSALFSLEILQAGAVKGLKKNNVFFSFNNLKLMYLRADIKLAEFLLPVGKTLIVWLQIWQ